MEAKKYALWLLGKRAYTIKGITDKLSGKNFSQKEIQDTVAYCTDHSYLNDIEYARNYIRNRDLLRPCGKRLIYLELSKKGVSRQDIDKVFEDVEILNRDEKDLAMQVVKRKVKLYSKLDRGVAYRRIFSLLARKGFNINTIKEVLDDYFEKE